jgi:hypothetical protein
LSSFDGDDLRVFTLDFLDLCEESLSATLIYLPTNLASSWPLELEKIP